MTKREAKRRLEHLALETGHKRDYYIKRALVEFLERKEHLLVDRRPQIATASRLSISSLRASTA